MSSLEKLTEWNALKKVSLKLHLPTTLRTRLSLLNKIADLVIEVDFL